MEIAYTAAMDRSATLHEALSRRILLLDGATGTALEAMELGPADFGGEALAGCNESLVLQRPEAVLRLHRQFLEAGADIVETNTFGATPVVLAEYGLEARAREVNRRAAELARQASAEYDTEEQPRWVAGSMGPTTRSLTLIGGITFQELLAAYRVQAEGLAEGGADVLLIETAQDALNLKAALIACREAAPGIPVAVSATVEPGGATLGGQTIEAVAVMVEPWEPLWVGLNCSTGPGPMREHVRALAALTPSFLSVVPNAGMPDEKGRYSESPERVAEVLSSFADEGWVNLLGGCCGTTADHIRALRVVADRHAPRTPAQYRPSWAAGGVAVPLLQERPPTLVGERTNALGSRKFRELIDAGRYAEAASVGRQQARRGAHLLDLCVADPNADETERMTALVHAVRRAVRIPLRVDSTDPQVMEEALEAVPGRPVLNSVNLEDGGARLRRIGSLARRFGCAVVAGCIDEHPTDGMARTAERKLEVARRLVGELEKLGLRREEILVDPLVFPAATGDPKFAGSAAETVEGIRRIREELPGVLTLAGVSNVSFGLPPAARRAVNAVFLHRCVEAGLDAAIVNTEALTRAATLEDGDVRLAEAVLFAGDRGAIEALADRFRGVRERRAGELADLPPEARLSRMVVEGEVAGLEETVAALLQTMDPLQIVNGPLMAGMDEVGRLFGDGQLIVAEVLVSAEVMQAAVDLVRPHLEAGAHTGRGSILLATVRGDVHDIGKNLVGMIFATNGWRVVDLGVQVPSERLVEAWRSDRTDLIGLSGLLVRSAHQMAATVADLTAEGVRVPVLVGGAALNPRFVRDTIAPAHASPVRYARDALEGLRLANAMASGEPMADEANVGKPAGTAPPPEAVRVATAAPVPPLPSSELPRPPDFARHEISAIALDEVLPLVNRQMLLGRHLGYRGSVYKALERGDVQAVDLAERVETLTDEALGHGWLAPAGVFRFVRAHSETDQAVLSDASGSELGRLDFPPRAGRHRPSAAVWIHTGPEAGDTVALMAVTAGGAYRSAADELRRAGRLLDSFALQALALEVAEASAEWLHRRIRSLWGLPDPAALSVHDILKARYPGIRLSPGYPSMPDLGMQSVLFSLLDPETIGISLTENLMMDPEASVSAVVLHHPDASY